jgi:hypothetical protein
MTLRLPARTDLGKCTRITCFLDVISSGNVLKVVCKRPLDNSSTCQRTIPKLSADSSTTLYTTEYPNDLRKHNLKNLEPEAKANNSDYTSYAVMYWNFDLAMFQIAHKYDLAHLEGEAQEYLEKRCEEEFDKSSTSGWASSQETSSPNRSPKAGLQRSVARTLGPCWKATRSSYNISAMTTMRDY